MNRPLFYAPYILPLFHSGSHFIIDCVDAQFCIVLPMAGAFLVMFAAAQLKDFDFGMTPLCYHCGSDLRMRTIIGVESFHCPVRDEKGWIQLAMVVRQKNTAGSNLQKFERRESIRERGR